MWDIVFKDHNGRKAPRNAGGSDFHEVMQPDIGNMAKKISQSSRKVRRDAGKTVYRIHMLLSRFLGTFPESVLFHHYIHVIEHVEISSQHMTY